MNHYSSNHGGAREGAGRKKGSGKYQEPTKVIRVPESKVAEIKNWLSLTAASEKLSVIQPSVEAQVLLPLFSHKVAAGFPSPADDYIEDTLDLNERLIHNKNTTFLVKVQGESMKDIGILEGDILVVDRSLPPKDGKIVIAAVDGELTVKRLSIKSTGTWLVPENDRFLPIPITEHNEVTIWGVVTSTIREF